MPQQTARGEDNNIAPLRVVGISFDHMHMGDLLREVDAHPDAEIAGIFDPDPARMAGAVATFGLPPDRVFTDLQRCLDSTRPDLAILCSAPVRHADDVEAIAPSGAHIMVEKPFASSVADARRMMAAVQAPQKLAINWPLAWYRSHNTAKRLLDEGRIGELIEVHFYDGNRGPLYHLADKVAVSDDEVEQQKSQSWFYKKASGGGSLIDYLGYGTTLGTWFHNGAAPIEVTAVVDETPGIEVDQHSVTVARYAQGLSKFETRWGTISDPWTLQPIPRCGFMLVGTEGAIASYDYDDFVTLQLRGGQPQEIAADPKRSGAVAYMVERIRNDLPIEGPLDPKLALIGQRIIDTALAASAQKRTLALLP
jgi:glucose-fructose oxidoreductase